jgi:hypothetical protein
VAAAIFAKAEPPADLSAVRAAELEELEYKEEKAQFAAESMEALR